MEKISIQTVTLTSRTYLALTKPGIILGNLVTMIGGFALASKGSINVFLFLTTLLGLSFIMASACVFNNYIDREADKKMERTKSRALALGIISNQNALIFASFLGILGFSFLGFFTNFLTLMSGIIGFFVYVIMYSFLKYRSVHGTMIGSIAGAMPPVVGYCSVSNHFDLGAFILFSMMFLWQMPHFFAIAIYRMEDYTAANIPILPIKKDLYSTKIQMLFYVVFFIAVSLLLTVFQYTGFIYLIVATLLGLSWLILSIQGFSTENDKPWARKMFLLSLIVVTGIFVTISFNV